MNLDLPTSYLLRSLHYRTFWCAFIYSCFRSLKIHLTNTCLRPGTVLGDGRRWWRRRWVFPAVVESRAGVCTRTPGQVWRHLWLSHQGRCCWHPMRDYPAMYRTALVTESPIPNACEVKKPWPRVYGRRQNQSSDHTNKDKVTNR